MKRANVKLYNGNGEEGVVLVTAVIFFVVIMGAIAYFNFAVPVSKQDSSALRIEVDKLCAEIAAKPLLAGDVITTFFGRLQKIEDSLKSSAITEANLYLPLMQYQRDPSNLNYNTDDHPGQGNSPNHIDPSDMNYKHSPCSVSSGECHVYPSYGWDGGIVPGDIRTPDTFGRHTIHSGTLIGCEVKAEISNGAFDNFLQPTALELNARVFYVRKPSNIKEIDIDEGGFDPDAPATWPQLKVIIDPFVQTRVAPRFDITAVNSSYSSFDAPAIDQSPASNIDLFDGGFPEDTSGNGSLAEERELFQDGEVDLSGTTEEWARYELPAITGGDLSERLISCINPGIMARNAFLYHFFSFIARDGFFSKDNVEVLMAQPKHRVYFGPTDDVSGVDVDETNAHRFHPGIPNPPVVVKPLGVGLFEKKLQLPFVNAFGPIAPNGSDFVVPNLYFDDSTSFDEDIMGASDNDGMGDVYQQGWTQPLIKQDAATGSESDFPHDHDDTDRMAYHSLFAGQLRDCFGLYRDGPSGIPSSYPYDGGDLIGLESKTDLNPLSGNVFATEAATRLRPAGNASDRSNIWSQNLGASYVTQDFTSGGGATPNDLVNLMEFVTVLGAGQQCPVANGSLSGYCQKPERGATSSQDRAELEGDIFGALAYLAKGQDGTNRAVSSIYTAKNGSWDSAINLSNSFSFPAIRLPGLFFYDIEHDISATNLSRFRPYDTANSHYLYRTDPFENIDTGDETPDKGNDIVVIVTSNAPRWFEVAMWRKYLTGAWQESSPGSGDFTLGSGANDKPRWLDLYASKIIVVQIPFHDDDHATADNSVGLWQNALMGHVADGSFFKQRKQVFYFGPYGFQRFGYDEFGVSPFSGETYANECNASPDPSALGPVESCDFGQINNGTPEVAYSAYWSALLSEDTSSFGEEFGGNMRERAERVYSSITARYTLF